ncbi:soluble cytochrome b562 [Erwinia toletana]|uniref:Soluble cytochrome b562 n=1 Tax=Winslowiella toletana TaxID=92490 RepID=A0ABS4P715_9GAMM|nr:cytochrome b562 [Winslowiella toletana]MBP2168429.1 soluble cytochrome b562 [Winslowiella toletana]
MHKFYRAMLAVVLLSSSVTALAQSLEDDMDILKGAYRTVQKTEDATELKKALTDMRAAAENAKTQTPDSLEGKAADSAEMKDYRAGLDTLIGQIDASKQLADAGDIAGAKAEAKKFADTRDANHKKFR